MQATREKLVALFQEMGFATCNNWDKDRWDKRLKALKRGLDPDTQPESEEGKALLGQLLKSEEDGTEVELIGFEKEEDNPKPSKKKGGEKPMKKTAAKEGTEKKASKNGKAAKKDPIPKDRFGMRLGTRAAQINEAITKKPKSMAEICKDAEVKGPIHSHMMKLLGQGHVKRDKESGKFCVLSK